MGGSKNFAPQARPKMGYFEQKTLFFGEFSWILMILPPFGGGFASKMKIASFFDFGTPHMGGSKI